MRSPILLAIFAALLVAGAAAAQQAKPLTDQEKAWPEQAVRMALAEAKSYEIRLRKLDGPQLALVEQSVLKWSHTEDATVHGSLLVWMHEGRPEAIASIFKFFTVKEEFSAEFHSLAEGPLVAVKAGHIVWQPDKAGVTFALLAAVAAPAKSAPARLGQMRAISRDFTGTMTTFNGTTHPLRLLTQPLLRYAGEKQHPLDGAIFAYARATDPDVLLLLEARGDGDKARWHYALARMHCGAVAMSYVDREVWRREQMSHPFARPQEEYTLLQGLPEPTKGANETTNGERGRQPPEAIDARFEDEDDDEDENETN